MGPGATRLMKPHRYPYCLKPELVCGPPISEAVSLDSGKRHALEGLVGNCTEYISWKAVCVPRTKRTADKRSSALSGDGGKRRQSEFDPNRAQQTLTPAISLDWPSVWTGPSGDFEGSLFTTSAEALASLVR